MTIIYLILGILLVGFAFSYNKVLGAALLIVVVLGMWLSAAKKGLI